METKSVAELVDDELKTSVRAAGVVRVVAPLRVRAVLAMVTMARR